MKKIVLSFFLLLESSMAIELGKVPITVTIDGKNGGKIDGSGWESSMLKGKIHTLFYVDPDKRDLNNPLADALKAKKFDRKKVNSVAIINLAATWLPNVFIESKLKEKQKKFPHTIYVKDKKKVLVKQWNLEDDNSDILIFDQEGKLIYKKFGKVSDEEIKDVIVLIEKNL
ncbi:MAG: YtfJ family protein [Sulfurovum sp.]|uniref:YtfJ family protein n=1 Tax=Sulfurovum sp. TaxID=1969726 RepID=UPI003C76CFEE